MAKQKVSINAYCPFYKSDDHQLIRCEGVAEGCTTHLAFANYGDFLNYRDMYCKTTRCIECRVAQMLFKKWEDIDAEIFDDKIQKPKGR